MERSDAVAYYLSDRGKISIGMVEHLYAIGKLTGEDIWWGILKRCFPPDVRAVFVLQVENEELAMFLIKRLSGQEMGIYMDLAVEWLEEHPEVTKAIKLRL